MIARIFLTSLAALFFSMLILTIIGHPNKNDKVGNIIVSILDYVGGASLIIMVLSLFALVVELIWS